MFEKQVVIDGKGHLLGRLASVVAKELLNGQSIVVVRSEQIFVTGSRKYIAFEREPYCLNA
jgi:large subunit ribosomal protein L13Ae